MVVVAIWFLLLHGMLLQGSCCYCLVIIVATDGVIISSMLSSVQ